MGGSEMRSFVVCTSKNLGNASGDDFTLGMVYEVESEEHGMLRLVDASGDDHLYPIDCFEEVVMSEESANRVHKALRMRGKSEPRIRRGWAEASRAIHEAGDDTLD